MYVYDFHIYHLHDRSFSRLFGKILWIIAELIILVRGQQAHLLQYLQV